MKKDIMGMSLNFKNFSRAAENQITSLMFHVVINLPTLVLEGFILGTIIMASVLSPVSFQIGLSLAQGHHLQTEWNVGIQFLTIFLNLQLHSTSFCLSQIVSFSCRFSLYQKRISWSVIRNRIRKYRIAVVEVSLYLPLY